MLRRQQTGLNPILYHAELFSKQCDVTCLSGISASGVAYRHFCFCCAMNRLVDRNALDLLVSGASLTTAGYGHGDDGDGIWKYDQWQCATPLQQHTCPVTITRKSIRRSPVPALLGAEAKAKLAWIYICRSWRSDEAYMSRQVVSL